MNVEIVIAGSLGDLASWAMPDVIAERRQVLLMAWSDMLPALNYLTERGLEVLTIRERAIPDAHDATTNPRNRELMGHPAPLPPVAGVAGNAQHGRHPPQHRPNLAS